MENLLARSTANFENLNIRRMLLLSGFFSSILYVVTDIIASLSYPGYSIADQNYSELLATGAPTRQWLLLSTWVYNSLVACFAVSILKAGTQRRITHVTGAVIFTYAIVSMITPLWFQMDMRGTESTPCGSLHPLMTAVMSFFILLSIGTGAFLSGRWFRVYSFLTIFIVIIFGFLTVNQVQDLAAGLDTPLMGLKERVNIYLTMAWFAVFSLHLHQKENE